MSYQEQLHSPYASFGNNLINSWPEEFQHFILYLKYILCIIWKIFDIMREFSGNILFYFIFGINIHKNYKDLYIVSNIAYLRNIICVLVNCTREGISHYVRTIKK